MNDDTQQIPDDLKIHLERIKEALKNGCAAVMVGAGFSKNAINGHLMPDWGELAKKLDLSENKRESLGSRDILRLAEEYEVLLGPNALQDFIKENIPNNKVVKPGKIHKLLLGLNWCDVFTTNYDTLLEDVDNGEYRTIRTIQDLPHSGKSQRKRIIKLHGSIPLGSTRFLWELRRFLFYLFLLKFLKTNTLNQIKSH